jgi:hypothetical protein
VKVIRFSQQNNATLSGKGGLATAVSSQLALFTTHRYNKFCDRATIVNLNGTARGALGLLHSYTPNEELHRSRFWERLSHLVDQDCQWLVRGDFNMALLNSNHRDGSVIDLSGQEAAAW